VTQPYDKISPAMQQGYLAANPYNLVRVILGEKYATDSPTDNPYTRAAKFMKDWSAAGLLVREEAPAIYPYFQTFKDPDTGESQTRRGFIALGALEPYEAGIVHRHELTLSGPKKDRLELLRATRAHFGQIFMLYSDAERAIDAILDAAALEPPISAVKDEYGVAHELWRITSAPQITRIQELMAPRPLVIADGHHRYETALAYQQESGVDHVMMTFVNTHAPGLRILATHRLLRNLPEFSSEYLIKALASAGDVEPVVNDAEVKAKLTALPEGQIAIGVIANGLSAIVHAPKAIANTVRLDVDYLHGHLLRALGIEEAAVRDQRNLEYIRGSDNAIAEVRNGNAQAAFLLKPAPIEKVMEISLSGGVMPQKSTDFYPKLLTGLTIWKVDE